MKRGLLIIAFLVAVCMLVPAAEFEEEAEVMRTMNAGMNRYADRMEELTGAEEFIEATNEMAQVLEEYGKAMAAIYREHADWGENPPKEVESILKDNMEAATRYDRALNAAARYASDHSEHEACQAAMKRLATAAYEMYQ